MLCALDKCRYYIYNESMTNNNTTTKETSMMREFEDSTEAFEADEREALTEYEVWRQEQIAEQEAFEARIDSLISTMK